LAPEKQHLNLVPKTHLNDNKKTENFWACTSGRNVIKLSPQCSKLLQASYKLAQ
jgi:hypothetical protein